MKSLESFAAPLFFVCVALAMSGCFSRQIVRFGTHEAKPVVLLETVDSTNYFVWTDNEHVFWSCVETNTDLDCSRRCGKGTDLKCPEVSIFQDAVGTNTR
jgi:hypothetical protein